MQYGSIVHTGLFSDLAEQLLTKVRVDVINWSNWSKRRTLMAFGEPERASDGECVFRLGKIISEREFEMTEAANLSETECRAYFGKCMKANVERFRRAGKCIEWTRTSNGVMPFLIRNAEEVTVPMYYFVYDVLMGRDVSKRYPAFMREKIVGEELDQVTASMNEYADSEAGRILEECENAKTDIYNKYRSLRRDLDLKENEERTAARNSAAARLKELAEKFGDRPSVRSALMKVTY